MKAEKSACGAGKHAADNNRSASRNAKSPPGKCPIGVGAAALSYVSLGWAVVPLHTTINGVCSCRRGKACPSPGKHPRTRHGVNDASSDPDQIRTWWKRWPNANVGIACGRGSKLIVLDVDPRNGGNLADIESTYGPLPATVRSETGGGGLHVLSRAEGGKSCDPPKLKGVNILADGKLFVAPPSLHVSGRRYGWAKGHGPTEIEIAPAPPWLVALCAASDTAPAPVCTPADDKNSRTEKTPKADHVRQAAAAMLRCRVRADESDGSKRLFVYACRAVEHDLTDDEAIQAMRAAGSVAPFPRHWTDDEIATRLRAAEGKTQRGKKTGNLKSSKGAGDGERPPWQADLLVEISAQSELWHTPGEDGDSYATIKVGEHIEHHVVRRKGFRRWLAREFYTRYGKVANSQAMQDAILAIEGKALFEGNEHAAHIRLAEFDGAIWLDLADADWRAVRIDRSGWAVVQSRSLPVRFVRRRGMLPLPVPVEGGSVNDLFRFVNVTNEDHRALLVTWIVATYRPRGPYPPLVVNGEQGSAKSCLCRIARSLVDPNSAPLRRPPRDDRDLMIAASNSWVVCFDNLSGISPALSDTLCTLATGGGFATRELYSDDDERLFDVMRPVVINGIEDIVTRGDLADRSVTLTLSPIDDDKRMREDELWSDFEAARPAILGAFLNAVSTAMRRLPEVNVGALPRMADYAAWSIAAEPALGLSEGSFVAAYTGNRESATAATVEASPIGPAILGLAHALGGSGWTGTSRELLTKLEAHHSDEATRKRREWPKSPRGLSGLLRRIAPNLRAMGIHVSFGEHTRRGTPITIENARNTPSQRSHRHSSATAGQETREIGDDGVTVGDDAPTDADAEPSRPNAAQATENGVGDVGDGRDNVLQGCSELKARRVGGSACDWARRR
ncbi:MAG: bifunctional DNA primase/polymerase [Phycisphaerales bacterium]|nr:bifunctional DNA primase/polymerase [Phycisphaerales bacterium]